jgi:hypothetical protein
MDTTKTNEYAHLTKSDGHLAFIGGCEYYVWAGHGVYRAPIDSPIDSLGFRLGRWECSEYHLATLVRILGIQQEREG